MHGTQVYKTPIQCCCISQGALGDLSLENGEGGGAPKTKRPGRPNALRRYIKLGLNAPAHQVSLGMEEFKENVDRKECYVGPEDPELAPDPWARDKVRIQAGYWAPL